MELKKCDECGRSFASQDGEKLCKRCSQKKVDDDFKKVRDYLYDHPGADIKVVAADTGVEEKIILKLLRADRIEVVNIEESMLKCVSCGTTIKSGTLCETCKKVQVAKDLNKVKETLKKDIEKPSESKKPAYYSR